MTGSKAAPLALAVTLGDPAGIGPEVVTKLLQSGEAQSLGVALTVFGDRRTLDALPVAGHDERRIATSTLAPIPYGAPTAASGDAAAQALFAAIDAAMRGEVAGIVTAPLSKEAMHRAGHAYPGQTEILVERSGVARGVMLFVGGGIKVALATRHIALRDVANALDAGAIRTDLELMLVGLRRDFGVALPRVVVTGLNPHAGEHGLFGDEESRVLEPALAAVRAAGFDVTGPLPADTAFVRLRKGEFDAAFAMYHDQGLIPVKLLAFGHGVNVTLGLPFVRTSPDHGTAYDIAGRGVADPQSMLEAFRLAVEVARNRAPLRGETSRSHSRP